MLMTIVFNPTSITPDSHPDAHVFVCIDAVYLSLNSKIAAIGGMNLFLSLPSRSQPLAQLIEVLAPETRNSCYIW